jgi:hypothetical protein
MEETTQQLIALLLVAIVVGLELLRRYRKKQNGKVGCEGCDTNEQVENDAEKPIKFYTRD